MAIIVTLLLLSGGILASAIVDNNGGGSPAWTSPLMKAIKLVGPAPDALEQPNFQSNLDCIRTSYRIVGSGDMRLGCFVQTAYGQFDPDNELIIFNSTDEALPLNAYITNQVITPWPGSLDVLSLTPALTGGSYIGLYRNILADLSDSRNLLAQLTAKNLKAPPDFMLRNDDSSMMVINPQTMAFSSGGSWLIVENLSGSFVRINLATLDKTYFAHSFGMSGSPSLLKSQVAVTKDGRYVAIENNIDKSFKLYDLNSCQNSLTTPFLGCRSYDYWPYIELNIAGLTSVRHLRFINSGLVSFVADHDRVSEVYELAPSLEIKSLLEYLAIGDSYTSGEGAFNYISGTDNTNNDCHLSINSYPLLISQQLYGGGGHTVACSGAKIGDVLPLGSNDYKGQASDAAQMLISQKSNILSSYMPGYLPQSDFVSDYQPGVMTVSIGGNDVGFADILKSCVIPKLSFHLSDGVCYNTYEDRVELKNLIDRTVPKWITLFKQLSSMSPRSKIYVVGYPQIFYDKGDCPHNVNLSKSELEFSAELTSYIDGAIEVAASKSGTRYIDVSEAFFGYRLCETRSYAVAVNGLTAGRDAGVFGMKMLGNESYHPNAFGQSLLKSAILKKSNNFTSGLVSALTSNPSDSLLNAPVTGRQIRNLIPSSLGNEVINRFRSNSFGVSGIVNSLRPNSSYILSLDKGSINVLPSVISDNQGNITGSYSLPAGITIGVHSLDLIGTDQTGQNVDIRQIVYIANSEDDIDGDGISNSKDSCPIFVNSGDDQDADGVDDACDGFIGAPTKPSADNSVKPTVQAAAVSNQSKSANVPANANSIVPAKDIGTVNQPVLPIKKISPAAPSNSLKVPVTDMNFRSWLVLTIKTSLKLLLILASIGLIMAIWSRIASYRRRCSLRGETTITYS